jgi:hypothetical protein
MAVRGRTSARSQNKEHLLPAGCLLLTAYCLLRQSLKTWYRNAGQLCGFSKHSRTLLNRRHDTRKESRRSCGT